MLSRRHCKSLTLSCSQYMGYGQTIRGFDCPHPRALLVNLKYHPHQTYWFLHRSHKASFSRLPDAGLMPCARVFVFSGCSLLRNTLTVTYFSRKVNAYYGFNLYTLKVCHCIDKITCIMVVM